LVVKGNKEDDNLGDELNKEKLGLPPDNSLDSQPEEKPNSVANTLDIIGKITIALGIIAAIIVIVQLQPTSRYSASADAQAMLAWIYGIAIGVSSFVSGMVFIGFGEIINILHRINNKIPLTQKLILTGKSKMVRNEELPEL
jgi:hypothetical protein